VAAVRSESQSLVDSFGSVFIKPIFKGGVGKKRKVQIGVAAEIDDHINRGRNMDTRTPVLCSNTVS
jgi:hypothetical protein